MDNHRRTFALGTVAILIAGTVAVLAGLPSTASGASRDLDRHGWPASSARPAAAITHAAHASVARSGGTVIVALEIEQRSASVDVGDAGESPGDYFLFEGDLKTPDGSRTIGR